MASEFLKAKILVGDAVLRMRELPDDSVDSIVTDPPYGIRFMGKAWDGADIVKRTIDRMKYHGDEARSAGVRGGHKSLAAEAGKYDRSISANRIFQQWTEAWAIEAFRVLKPGGYLLCFASPRTYHRMASGVEEAGFDIRDQIMWMFGSGFPKSHNISKAIDRMAGAEREVIGSKVGKPGYSLNQCADPGGVAMSGNVDNSLRNPKKECEVTAPSTESAKRWEGWGTALKPAHEPIVVARKPFKGSVAANVLKYGTGALNIGACLVEGEPVPINRLEKWSGFDEEKRPAYEQTVNDAGRWPANVIHDGSDEVLDAFPDAPGQCADAKVDSEDRKTGRVYGAMKRGHEPSADRSYEDNGVTDFSMKPGARRSDEGSAARFFYTAKASKQDREEGCSHLGQAAYSHDGRETPIDNAYQRNSSNSHPTVKPTDLMQYLCRLVTPPGGTILDPFMGSGSTGKAALLEGLNFIGIELEKEYVEIARARIATSNPLFSVVEVHE